MEENLLNPQSPEIEQDKPQLYSRNAILFMSFIFASIFGGWMLVQNLRKVGNTQAALSVGIFSLLYFVLTIVITMIPANPVPFLGIALNYIGGKILADYFLLKLIPGSSNYPKRSVLVPVIISVLISLLIVLLALPEFLNQVK